ncbi:MAG: hypothetical protein GXX96_35455 [Planctomycetaceae bacterium]|nr:hypothetical protein [Planctomycetaceae bacterium]
MCDFDPYDNGDSDSGNEAWTDYGPDGNGPTGTGPITYDSGGNIVPDKDDD